MDELIGMKKKNYIPPETPPFRLLLLRIHCIYIFIVCTLITINDDSRMSGNFNSNSVPFFYSITRTAFFVGKPRKVERECGGGKVSAGGDAPAEGLHQELWNALRAAGVQGGDRCYHSGVPGKIQKL